MFFSLNCFSLTVAPLFTVVDSVHNNTHYVFLHSLQNYEHKCVAWGVTKIFTRVTVLAWELYVSDWMKENGTILSCITSVCYCCSYVFYVVCCNHMLVMFGKLLAECELFKYFSSTINQSGVLEWFKWSNKASLH